ncbi:MAG: cytochrome c biogenesis protein [Candidatus Accumulibacter sp.]|jgi:hypothetical protein|nr:cytochrome c biogenesis protein [Accumulibacter sp.]
MFLAPFLLPLTVGFLAVSLALALSRAWRGFSRWTLVPATICGLAYLALRYWGSWPMTPMYLGTVGLPPLLAALGFAHAGDSPETRFVRAGCAILALALGLASLFFPKDFYLPFLKTASLFSHAYLIFTRAAKSALLFSGLWSAACLSGGRQDPSSQRRAWNWLAGGFGLWTLAMFSGEIWSYRGWGVPVVWEDATIIAFTATWFYYIGLLHLHLTRRWPTRARHWASVAGVLLILALNCSNDLGPFRPPLR